MILSLYVVNSLAVKEKAYLDEFWSHSYYTALCSKYLVKKYEPRISSDDIWSAAILHDIGKLVYLKFFPDHFKAIKQFQKENACLFSQAENNFPFPTSSFLGALLCDHWKLPDKVKVACESHGMMDLKNLQGNSVSTRFIKIICLGNLTAVLVKEDLNQETIDELTAMISTALNCPEPEFLSLMEEIRSFKDEVKNMKG